jgi:hypothetical protein
MPPNGMPERALRNQRQRIYPQARFNPSLTGLLLSRPLIRSS